MFSVRCFPFRKTRSPCPTLRSNRDQMGDGSSPLSLSRADIGRAPLGGCQLPDAILHGKRSCRPHSRAVQRLAVAEFRVRPLSSLRLAFADAGLRTRSSHVCDFVSASRPFSAGSAIAFGNALARCHGSDLLSLRLPFAHKPAVSFVTSPAF